MINTLLFTFLPVCLAILAFCCCLAYARLRRAGDHDAATGFLAFIFVLFAVAILLSAGVAQLLSGLPVWLKVPTYAGLIVSCTSVWPEVFFRMINGKEDIPNGTADQRNRP